MLSSKMRTPDNIKSKIINLKIELNAPDYDGEGKLIHPEDELSNEEELDDKIAEYFNAMLLDEEILNSQVYEGSMTSSDDGSEKK